MTIVVACVGLAIDANVSVDNIRGFIINKRKNKTLIGVPFQGALPFDNIQEALEQQIPSLSGSVIGNYSFVTTMNI